MQSTHANIRNTQKRVQKENDDDGVSMSRAMLTMDREQNWHWNPFSDEVDDAKCCCLSLGFYRTRRRKLEEFRTKGEQKLGREREKIVGLWQKRVAFLFLFWKLNVILPYTHHIPWHHNSLASSIDFCHFPITLYNGHHICRWESGQNNISHNIKLSNEIFNNNLSK